MTRKSEPTAEGKARKAKKNAPVTSAPSATQPTVGIELPNPTDKTQGAVIAELRMSPFIRHGTVASCMAAPTVTFDGPVKPLEASGALKDIADKVAMGDLRHVSDTLLSQSVVLDTTMTELMRRAWLNAAEYPEAFNRYMTLALKAQAQSRTTLEALARLHQPREQIVRHVHVYEGGQAMVAEQLHVHGPGVGNARRDDQCQAASADSTGKRAALSRPDPLGQCLPGSSGAGQTKMPDARRKQSGSAAWQSERLQTRAS